jgi:hypothetical protein
MRRIRVLVTWDVIEEHLAYCDNVSAVYLSTNLIQHNHMKHVEIDLHFV